MATNLVSSASVLLYPVLSERTIPLFSMLLRTSLPYVRDTTRLARFNYALQHKSWIYSRLLTVCWSSARSGRVLAEKQMPNMSCDIIRFQGVAGVIREGSTPTNIRWSPYVRY